METVISTVVALCMFVAGELKEHRIQPAMSDCLKGKGLRNVQQMIILNICVEK
jgi:hypothetical protein